jgi:hypothetical protein
MKEPSSDGLHSEHLYSLPEPYPKPKVTAENHYYASLLLQDYAGISGELTAINQSIYIPLHYPPGQPSRDRYSCSGGSNQRNEAFRVAWKNHRITWQTSHYAL